MAGCLQNSFADVLLSVGLDNRLGYSQAHGSTYDVSGGDDVPVAGCPYKPEVLSVCTCHGDLTDVTLHQNDPDNAEGHATLSRSSTIARRGQNGSQQLSQKNKLSKRKTSRLSSFRSSDIRIRSSKKGTNSAPELPISADVIRSLTAFCFPDNAYVYNESQEDYCHYLVLTDITGVRSYVSCLTFWIPYLFTRIKGNNGNYEWQCVPATGSGANVVSAAGHTNSKHKDCILHLPQCCVLVSKQPYFSVMREALSLVVAKIKKDPEEMNTFLSDMALQLTSTVAPPCGSLGVSFNLDGIQLMLPPGELHGYPVVDLPLNLIFLSFPVDQVLRLLSAVMSQQRIVFLSAEYSLLTVISQIILTFVLPFRWHLTYVPVLPSRLLELIDAPGSFIMGCHSRHRSLVNQVQGLVIADIEQGEVRICSSLDVPHIPEFAVLPFKQAFSKLQLHYEMSTLSSPPMFSYEEMRGNKQAFLQKFNIDIQTAFLELWVNIFRDSLGFIKSERMFFNKDAFLESQPPEDLPFYTQVLGSDLFGQFLRDRLSQKMDQWAIHEEKTRPKIRNSLGSPEDHNKMIRLSRAKRESKCLSLSEYVSEVQQSSIQYIQLPYFNLDEVDYYLEKCHKELRTYIQTCKNVHHQASCHYMCGMLSLACGSLITCLEHFHHLSSTHSTLFPVSLATELIHKMTDMEKNILRSTDFFKKSEILKTLLNKKTGPIYQPIIMQLDKIPQDDVDLQGFMEYVQILEICADHDTIARLFEALTLGRKPVLDPVTFEIFYECWKEIERECASKLPVLEGFLDRYECVLKVSAMSKSDFGMGRIVLTQKRLLFLQEGSHKCKEIIKLREISKIEKIQQTIFLKKVNSLKIFSVNAKNEKSGFVVCLKEARNCWYMVIQEMWVGKYIAEELRDPGIIQQAAHNVLLIDALTRSGEEECTSHHSCIEQAAAHLCYFTSRKDQHQLSPETKDVLQHRVNPNIREGSARSTVEALLYTPGNRSSSDEDIGPKLWCGMGSGKILIYDASTWLLDRQCIQAADRVVCLLAVGVDFVWAGSFDKAVYIIDIHTKSSNQTLREHSDMISDLTISYDASVVYSASLNGQIIAWDAQTLKHRQFRHLVGIHSLKAIKCIGSELWCCTRDEVLIFNTEGTMLRRLQHVDTDKKTVQLDTFLITKHNQVWVGGSRMGEVVIYDADSLQKVSSVKVKCRGISKMVSVQDRVWAGSKGGVIYIFNSVTHKLEKTLKAHTDAVRSICLAQNRYVMTGAGSADGKVAIWKTSY